jgi:STE24 endopeptidase
MNEDKATRYHRLKRRTAVLALVSSAALLAGLLWTGASAALRNAAVPAGSLTVVVYVFELALVVELIGLPLSFYGDFVLERRYGLSGQPPGAWLLDEAKSLVLTTSIGAAAASLVYVLIERWPASWWLPAGAAAALVMASRSRRARSAPRRARRTGGRSGARRVRVAAR